MVTIKEYLHQVKNSNNQHYFRVFDLISNTIKTSLIQAGFFQVNQQLKSKDNQLFWTSKNLISFSYVSNDYQHLTHLSFSLLDMMISRLSRDFDLGFVSGLVNSLPVVYLKLKIGHVRFFSVKIIKQNTYYTLKGKVELNYETIVDIIKNQPRFKSTPIQIVLLPIQTNNLVVKQKLFNINQKLSKSYRTLLDTSDNSHLQKIKLADSARIPFVISLGNKDVASDTINLTNLTSKEFKRLNLKNLTGELNRESGLSPNQSDHYLCGRKDCLKKIKQSHFKVLLSFNQSIKKFKCDICDNQALKRVQLIKEAR